MVAETDNHRTDWKSQSLLAYPNISKQRTERQNTNKAMSSMPYSARGNATNCTLYINIWPNRRAASSGQDSAGHLHLKESKRSFEDSQVPVLAGEDRWFERGVKDGGGQRHFLSPPYNVVLHSMGQHSKQSHRLMKPDDSPSCDPTDKGDGS